MKKTAAKAAKKKTTTAKLLSEQATDGWTGTFGDGYADGYGTVWPLTDKGVDARSSYARFERGEGELQVVILLNVPHDAPKDAWDKRRAFGNRSVEGHTTYNGRSFTRVGVDCGSCSLRDAPEYGHEYASVADLLAGEWERCRAAHERSKTMVSVPGLPGGWSVTPERRAQIAADLKAGKCGVFLPHGFGTGYRISTKRVAQHWRPLSTDAATFFGVERLYHETLDCD